MYKLNLISSFIFFILFLSNCKENVKYSKKPFFDDREKHIGDSIFKNNSIQKIVFNDTSYEIDSVVFKRFHDNPNVLESIFTFKNGSNIFENVEYFENGKIRRYKFIDDDNKNSYYERLYDSDGKVNKINGSLFFQAFIIDTTSNNLNFSKGSTTCYRFYFPNPPDCHSKMFIKDEDGKLYDVFTRSHFLNYLETVYQDHNKEGFFKTSFLLELTDKSKDTISRYNQSINYRVFTP